MAPKRRPESTAAGAGAGAGTAAAPWKRARAAAPGSGGVPEPAGPPAPSPGKRLRAAAQTVLVVLFLIRGKDSGADSFSRIGRVLRAIWSKLEGLDGRIQALTNKVDKISRSSPTHHDHQRLMNQEGTSAKAQGLATTEGEGEITTLRLRFSLNEVKSPVYQDNEIKSKTDESIKIGIYDGETMIKSGPLSKVKIEVLALEGNFPYHPSDIWTAHEFNQHRARGRDGNGNVLVGEGKTVRLIDGECDLGSIKFREGSSKSPKGTFIIGARVRDDGNKQTNVRVQEAIMNPVVVQVSRNKENQKNYPPKPNDEVHRLEAIAKNGKYCKRLEKKSIITVQDFVRALNKDYDNLASILQIKKKCKAWKKMTRHASECHLEGMHKLKSYCCNEQNIVLFFNCLHYLVGARFGDCYTASEKFSLAQQALVNELKKGVYDQIDALPENHVMSNDIPVLIRMDTLSGSCAGPSIMSRTTPQNNSSIPVPAVEGSSNAQIEPSCFAVANNDPGPVSFIPDPQSTHNYQDSRLPNQEQFPMVCPIGQTNSSAAAIECSVQQLFGYEDSGYVHLLDPAYSLNRAAAGLDQMEIQRQHFWLGNDSFEALTSAHINTLIAPQHLTISDAPGSAQGSMSSQIQAPFPNNGASEASTTPTLPSQQ